ncbi:helix-turn-helix domain-containing protein [Streptomyces prunicolor]|uniref:Helix-turn-helix transcriptional regulator n=1 Tax=Streptomyces prunicolor TaxID=67348 RepID=A0ABU4F592_9ACTN|nr:helix-turn-helix transcriptional regulator [Streptomyces prunicolor]MDV7215746.1 helix-turn-helix transcriptional regulator [Streptomyces prunicolor]
MAPRSQPTARQVRLGTELRKLRVSAGMSAREVVGILSSTSAQMSQVEAGLSGVSEERLRKLAALYGCGDEALIEALVEMATERTRGWWVEYRDILPPEFLDLAELENHARFIQVIATAHVPGLLQTEEYARAVFGYWVPPLPDSELELWVAYRMRRQQILSRDSAVPYEAVLHESVLRTRVADRRVARAQLDQLVRQSERPSVLVRVIPFDVDGFAGASSSLVYAGGRVPMLDTVQRDTPYGSAFLDDAAQLHDMRTLFRKVEEASLDPIRSRDFIHRLSKEL